MTGGREPVERADDALEGNGAHRPSRADPRVAAKRDETVSIETGTTRDPGGLGWRAVSHDPARMPSSECPVGLPSLDQMHRTPYRVRAGRPVPA